MTNPIKDITQDVDVIMLIGSNTTEAHPVVGVQIRQALQRGTKLIVTVIENVINVKNKLKKPPLSNHFSFDFIMLKHPFV